MLPHGNWSAVTGVPNRSVCQRVAPVAGFRPKTTFASVATISVWLPPALSSSGWA